MEYSLRERVVVIAGPLSTTVQSLMSGLTAEGADVALLDTDAKKAERFCAQLSDLREVKSKHGRAMAVTTDFTDLKKILESVGHVAQTFGGVDVLVDAQLHNQPTPFKLPVSVVSTQVSAVAASGDTLLDTVALDQLIGTNLRSSILLTQAMAGFLKGRKKGRIIYLMNDSVLRPKPEDAILSAIRSGLVGLAQGLSRQMMEHNVTVNTISLGLTEEYLLAHEPGILIKEALERQRQTDPYARITEPEKITNALVALIGSSGASITGQLIRLI